MEFERPPPASPAADVSFAIAYEQLAGTHNPDLKGRGVLTAAADGSVFRFSGRQRALFARGTTELSFAANDIRNVVVGGRAVQFSTPKGRAGQANKPFGFFCRDAGEAAAVARLLPKHVDQDFAASADFHEKLRGLAGARHPLTSVTNLIIAANVIVFVVMAGFLGAGWIDPTNLVPYVRFGANNGAATTDGEWWRLLTSMFMHYGILHLLLNMWALFQSGHLVERLQGRVLYGITYLASGIGGGLLSIAWHGDKTWSAGASGAIFGVYGALLGHMLKEKQTVPRAVFQPLLKSTLTFAGYNLFYGMIHPQIDNAAHVGGFLTGAVFGWLTAMPVDSAHRAALQPTKVRLAIVTLGVMVVLGIALTPRFDYSVRDELAWSDAVKGFADREADLVGRENTEMTRWQRSHDNGPAFARLIEEELSPFYRKFKQQIDALPLVPGRETEARRNALSKFMQFRLDGYEHLSRSLKTKDNAEFAAYAALDAQAAEVIAQFRQSRPSPPRGTAKSPAAAAPAAKKSAP